MPIVLVTILKWIQDADFFDGGSEVDGRTLVLRNHHICFLIATLFLRTIRPLPYPAPLLLPSFVGELLLDHYGCLMPLATRSNLVVQFAAVIVPLK